MKTFMLFTKLKVLLLIPFFLIISSTVSAVDLWPMQVGMWWEYDKNDSSSPPMEWTMRYEVLDKVARGNQEYFYVAEYDFEPGVGEPSLLRSTENAVYVYDEDVGAEYLGFQIGSVGTRWIADVWNTGQENYEIIDITQITVPYGTFDNVYVLRSYEENYNGPDSPYNYSYVVPGLGIVRNIDSIYVDSAIRPATAELARTSIAPGSVWNKYPGNPVFSPGGTGEWDNYLGSVSVLKDESEAVNKYKMWYVGGEVLNNVEGAGIGYATSADGINWVKYGNNPVLTYGDSWNINGISGISVIKDGSIYKLWYEGTPAAGGNRIGYATSTDGINWIKYGNNPVFLPGDNDAWDNDDVGDPCIIKEGSTYKMWYWGDDILNSTDQIGLATSTDGIIWQRVGSAPVMSPDPGVWWENGEGVGTPKVIKNQSGYIMAYHAANVAGTIRIGTATSSDGLTWTKDDNNPVLDLGAGSDWDSGGVLTGTLIEDGSMNLKLWYLGMDISASEFDSPEIGLATYLYGTGVNEHVSLIEISKSIEYYSSNPYNVDVGFQGDSTVFNATVQIPDGSGPYDLLDEDDTDWFGAEIIFTDLAALAALPEGDYVFTINYTDGTSDTTTVTYEEPGGGDIPLITQEPVLTNPPPGANNVPTLVTFRWDPTADSNISGIGLEWAPASGSGLSGDVSLSPDSTEYGPVQLTQNVQYELGLNFGRGYFRTNSDGIDYVIDADSEQKFYFYTTFAPVPHPYDTNQDWVIGDFELLDAIDAWAAGNLGDFDLLDLIDFWAAGCYRWDDVTENYQAGFEWECSTWL